MKKQKKDPLYKSFGYAFAGIFAVVTKERNMKIHCVAMVCVVIAGFVFSYYTGRVVYLPDIVWSCHGIGNGEYGGRSSG